MYMQGQENMYGGLRVTSACHMGEVKLIDSKVKSTLPSSLKEQLARAHLCMASSRPKTEFW